jgi:hypothetical protein
MIASAWARRNCAQVGPVRRRGIDPGLGQNLPHRGGGDPDTQSGELAVDATVAPARILAGQPQDQATDVAPCGGPARAARPDLAAHRRRSRSRCHRSTVSGVTSSFWGHQQPQSRPPGLGDHTGQRGDQRPVGPCQSRPAYLLALQYAELVTQQQDLGFLPCALPAGQPRPGEHADDENVDEPKTHDHPSCSTARAHPSSTNRSASLQLTRGG